jgi:transcriptional regulator with XRE-family HTH domain
LTNSEKNCIFAKICQDYQKLSKMFIERIKQLREERQLPLRKLAAALDIDSATYWKIERGERRAKKEYIPIIAELLQADKDDLLTLWLADQVTAVVAEEKELASKALTLAKENIKPLNLTTQP